MKQAINQFIKNYWDALLTASIACIWVLIYTKHSGIGISPDSVSYLSAANNIADYCLFVDFDQTPFVLFPLGYPIFLSVIKLLCRAPLLSIAPCLNMLIFSGTLFMTSYIIQQLRFTNTIIRLLLLLLVVSSPAILEVYTMLWSETIFIFFVLLFFVALKKYLASRQLNHLIIAAMVTAFAFTVRYAGVTCVITGCILIFLGEGLLKKKLLHLFIFGTIGSSLTLINLIRNSLVSGTYAGVREKAINSFNTNLADLLNVLQYWFNIPHASLAIVLLVLVIIVLIACVIIIHRLLQPQYFAGFEIIVAIFSLIYIGFMLVVSSISRFETLSSRLLSPVYIPLYILITIAIVFVLKKSRKSVQIILTVIFLSGYAYAQHNQYLLNKETWEGVGTAGIPGYTEDEWTQSLLVAYLKTHSKEINFPVFSNANDAVFFLAGVKAKALPHKDLADEIEKFNKNKSFTVVWFFLAENTDLIDRQFINQQFNVKSTQQFKDGVIYNY